MLKLALLGVGGYFFAKQAGLISGGMTAAPRPSSLILASQQSRVAQSGLVDMSIPLTTSPASQYVKRPVFAVDGYGNARFAGYRIARR